MHFQICGNNDGNIIHVFKNCISISVATVLEVSKMTVPICASHWCLVMSTCTYTQRHCHVRIEKGPVQTFAIKLEAHNSLEYHYMLKH